MMVAAYTKVLSSFAELVKSKYEDSLVREFEVFNREIVLMKYFTKGK